MSYYGEDEYGDYGGDEYGGGGDEYGDYGGDEYGDYGGGDDYGDYGGGGDDYGVGDDYEGLDYQSSFSDLSRTSSQSTLLQAKNKYFVMVLNKFINETSYVNDSDKEQILNTLSSNLIENIDYLNPKMMVLGWLVITNKQIDTSPGSFFSKIIKNDKDLVIDDVIRYANFIIQKIYNK